MSHTNGENNPEVRTFAWDTFLKATDVIREYGHYAAAGQGGLLQGNQWRLP